MKLNEGFPLKFRLSRSSVPVGREVHFVSSSRTNSLHLQKKKKSAELKPPVDVMMRSAVGLCVLSLLCLHSTTYGQDQEAAGSKVGILVFCDDLNVEKAVENALNSFNEEVVTGHKLALYQILTASKSENGSDSVYWLQFSSRRSDCPAGSNKPWKDCNYLPQGKKDPISCNATVHMTETETKTTQVDCEIDDRIVPDKADCLGCPEEVDVDSEELKVPVSVSINKFNSMSDSTHLFTLNSVSHATRQVVAGLRFKLKFDMRKSICAKSEHKELHNKCFPDEENVEETNCNSTVDIAPWRHEPPEAHIECGPGPLPTMFGVRRRPPGWSPLRNFFFQVSPTATPDAPIVFTSAAPAKEESSEEDTATVAPTGVSDADPFHCPSQPWKHFSPFQASPAAPTQAATEASSP
ncbi:hypothetical protein LDENG_00065890 [Lucifuga dentata]|nr:hypothetical protein LDENG_00065890 [Lucifuga dentata]